MDADCLRHHLHKNRQVDGLDEVAKGAQLDGACRSLDRGPGSDDHHRHVEIVLAHGAQQLDAGHARHGDVADNGVVALLRDESERGLAVVGGRHREALAREDPLIGAQHGRVVIDHQYATATARLVLPAAHAILPSATSHHFS